jgi:hypothetical protein
MLGFDALGHFPLGHPPDPAQSATLTASGNSFSLTGQALAFTSDIPEGAQSFALTGITSPFTFREIAGVSLFTLTGVAASFAFKGAVTAGGYVLTGMAAADAVGEPVNPPCAFALSMVATTFAITNGALAFGAFGLSGVAVSLTRDFVNWLKEPAPSPSWNDESAGEPSWTEINPPISAWNGAAASAPAWSPLAPPSQSWTIDPVPHILPPVSE